MIGEASLFRSAFREHRCPSNNSSPPSVTRSGKAGLRPPLSGPHGGYSWPNGGRGSGTKWPLTVTQTRHGNAFSTCRSRTSQAARRKKWRPATRLHTQNQFAAPRVHLRSPCAALACVPDRSREIVVLRFGIFLRTLFSARPPEAGVDD